ncbi:SPX domain-containing protein [Calycina marina]|uniref:SPX domain-containing protein n=1 Tax=Calycina marina TaxID=1763456 RepID=A0A9P7Z6V2_9HELO|nr:SPX domain-containing protein [Calycina marina]
MPKKKTPQDSEGIYGSFIRTPPLSTEQFELPGPAVSPQTSLTAHDTEPNERPEARRSASITVPPNAYEIGQTTSPNKSAFASLRAHGPHNSTVRPFIRRMFSVSAPVPPPNERTPLDVNMIAVDQVREKQKDFFQWMDKQLDKVESFYIMKEDEAGTRLLILREQLHEMRNRRIEELSENQSAKAVVRDEERSIFDFYTSRVDGLHKKDNNVPPSESKYHRPGWRNPFERVIEGAKTKILGPGSNSKALQKMGPSPHVQPTDRLGDSGQDYVRRHHNDVPYRSAKRKLKLALQEFYRGMELLKSYSLLNRTAFRKINKKYDKAVNAHSPLRYMSDRVKKARFVQSDVLDGHMHAVEDLYARYFERGNNKIATGKLRSGRNKTADQSGSAFRNGILIGVGAVFNIQGVIYASSLLRHADSTIRVQTSYLLQIYGGYFLALYLFSWFCLACSIWTKNKINYQFVFEFDTRHNLDWRQLSEFPSFLVFLLGLFVWLNFSCYGAPEMFIYYPVILIFTTVLLIFFPFPTILHRSRRWLVYSHVSINESDADSTADMYLVAIASCRFIPRRVSRLLSWRYVLFFDLLDECKSNA